MAQLQTQLLRGSENSPWVDSVDTPWITINVTADFVYKQEYDHVTGNDAPNTYETPARVLNSNSVTFTNGDSIDFITGIYTFADNQPNRFQTPNLAPIPSSDVDTSMGANYYEEDLTTNVKKYFAESFKFDGSQFEMDGDRIVGLKQSFIDTLATDLTNIVNTSISTATLTADTATINQTLTALGINTDLLKTKDLRLVDAQGHEHKLHLGN